MPIDPMRIDPMRIDVVTIFPDYLAPLNLSLIGRARAAGIVEIAVHDLREFTHDRHRTVDDAPAGGGAGMVMRPEPWGEALDHLLAHPPASLAGVEHDSSSDGPVLLVPSPSGRRFDQTMAHELAGEPWLIHACGRYEGIDERVIEHFSSRIRVQPISLGDYVLNGGEVAALAVTEAVVRLLPGVVGNAESLVEESHEGHLLEYPVYTRPASWRDLDIPEVLSSGHHARIAAWRHEQRLRRTARRRPDLLQAWLAERGTQELTAGERAALRDEGVDFEG